MGHTVHELDLGGKVGFNVLDWIDIASPLADTHVLSVVAWICGEEPEKKSGTAQFFEAKGRHLVPACSPTCYGMTSSRPNKELGLPAPGPSCPHQ